MTEEQQQEQKAHDHTRHTIQRLSNRMNRLSMEMVAHITIQPVQVLLKQTATLHVSGIFLFSCPKILKNTPTMLITGKCGVRIWPPCSQPLDNLMTTLTRSGSSLEVTSPLTVIPPPTFSLVNHQRYYDNYFGLLPGYVHHVNRCL